MTGSFPNVIIFESLELDQVEFVLKSFDVKFLLSRFIFQEEVRNLVI